jgi:hypothetical protein
MFIQLKQKSNFFQILNVKQPQFIDFRIDKRQVTTIKIYRQTL